jgi:hypothetical protein
MSDNCNELSFVSLYYRNSASTEHVSGADSTPNAQRLSSTTFPEDVEHQSESAALPCIRSQVVTVDSPSEIYFIRSDEDQMYQKITKYVLNSFNRFQIVLSHLVNKIFNII